MTMEYFSGSLFVKAEDVDKSLIALKNYVRKDGMFSEIFHSFNHDQENDSYVIVVMDLSPIREYEDENRKLPGRLN